MSTLQISQREMDGVTILDLQGPITMGDGSVGLRRAIRSLVEQNRKMILLNMAKVAYIDSSGLGELVAGFTSVQKGGGEMKLAQISNRASELMTITKLVTVFDIFDDEESALASFTRRTEDLTTGRLRMPIPHANSIA